MSGIKIGFKFNKISKPKSNIVHLPTIANDDNEKDGNIIDFVTSIDNKTVKGTKEISKKTEYIIPLIAVNKYKLKNDPVVVKQEVTTVENPINNDDDIVSKAKRELLEEAKGDSVSEIPAWKSLIINKAPDEYENDSKLDVSIRPEVPTLENYESIPIEAFGMAMLRGMGWNEGEAIGGINKSVTPIFEPQLRPRGLGLGADASLKKQLQEAGDNKKNGTCEEVPMRKGCHICVEIGPYKGYYGIIENVSDDLSFVTVKLKFLSETIDVPQALLRIVTKKEFEQEGRVINKSKYDDYKQNNVSGSESNHLREKKKEEIWIVPNIRVQIIDKNFKNGKYYKEKCAILKTYGKRCTCKCSNKKILEDISQSMLRTVIPRGSEYVMILRGDYKGKLARIKETDRHRNTVLVSLSGTISKPISLSMDDVSELIEAD